MLIVGLIEERRFDPPRAVEIEHNGRWWTGRQSRWLLCDDGAGWRAQVEWSELYEWGLGKHMTTVPPERLRPSTFVGSPASSP
jgi:hypothetical protein